MAINDDPFAHIDQTTVMKYTDTLSSVMARPQQFVRITGIDNDEPASIWKRIKGRKATSISFDEYDDWSTGIASTNQRPSTRQDIMPFTRSQLRGLNSDALNTIERFTSETQTYSQLTPWMRDLINHGLVDVLPTRDPYRYPDDITLQLTNIGKHARLDILQMKAEEAEDRRAAMRHLATLEHQRVMHIAKLERENVERLQDNPLWGTF